MRPGTRGDDRQLVALKLERPEMDSLELDPVLGVVVKGRPLYSSANS